MSDQITAAHKRRQMLALWANGVDSRVIAEELGFSDARSVRSAVAEARKRGDPRAAARVSGRRKKSDAAP